ncbi:hypothetical protein AB6A40_011563 [Gnathostoma spinigerum]|uniref:Uncharacterized protein n=1 Tax=Gnathostoma spinigerum TaxID=75299 RepID=A0ABD6EY01_9BILA
MKRICNRKCQRNYYFNTYENDKHFASIAYSMFPRTISLDNSGNSRKMIPSVIAAMFNMSNKEPTRDQVLCSKWTYEQPSLLT